jgi:ribose transport system permease protein
MQNAVVKDVLRRKETGIVVAAGLLFFIFSVTSSSFLTAYNLFNISRTLSLYVFIALAQAMAIVVGGLNLSVGAIGGLVTITVGYFLDVLGFSGWIAVPAGLLAGLLAGAVNGFFITKVGINSFVVTLSTLFVYEGLVSGISKGYSYTKIPKTFTIIGRKGAFGMPYLFWIALATLLVVFYIFRFTVFGRRVLATGGNLDAARLSGIDTDRIILAANTLSGLFSAIAAVLWVSRMGSAQPSTGQDWLIVSFAVAIIGGTALKGGTITPLGLLMGGIIMVLIKNGLVLLGANIYFERTFYGLIILLAVIVDRVRAIYTVRSKL